MKGMGHLSRGYQGVVHNTCMLATKENKVRVRHYPCELYGVRSCNVCKYKFSCLILSFCSSTNFLKCAYISCWEGCIQGPDGYGCCGSGGLLPSCVESGPSFGGYCCDIGSVGGGLSGGSCTKGAAGAVGCGLISSCLYCTCLSGGG